MRTFVDVLTRSERVPGDREALICGEVRLTYAQFLDRCRRLSTVLTTLGTVPGDRVAVLAFNSIAFTELYCTVSAAGRVQVPLNFRWADAELAYALEDSGSKVLFIDREPGPLADVVESVVRLDTGEYEELLAGAEPAPFDPDAVHEDDLAALLYTGGTTGASKGVILTHRNLLANTFNMQMFVPLTPEDVFIIVAPMFHAAGSLSVLQALSVGITQVIVPAFDPPAVLETLEREQATVTIAVPTMLAALVEEQLINPRRVDTLRAFMHGGSPVALEVLRRATKAFPATELIHVYGATELAGLGTGLRDEQELLDRPEGRSAGITAIGVSLVVRDPSGAPVPDGVAGEVTLSGANVLLGYWNKKEQTDAAIRDGWYWSGDVGRLDERGNLFLLDRSKDMIISGGENIFCGEVEDALYSHPSVLEAAVFGIPDNKWGEVPHAVVVPRDDVTAEALIAHCRDLIAGYKVPKSIDLQQDPLPKSGPGKVLKRELRKPYWEGKDRQIS